MVVDTCFRSSNRRSVGCTLHTLILNRQENNNTCFTTITAPFRNHVSPDEQDFLVNPTAV